MPFTMRYAGVLQIPIRYAYTISNLVSVLSHRAFSTNMGSAQVGNANPSGDACIFLCKPTGYYTVRTPNGLTANYAGNAWDNLCVADSDGRLDAIYMLGVGTSVNNGAQYTYKRTFYAPALGDTFLLPTSWSKRAGVTGTNTTNVLGAMRLERTELQTWEVNGNSAALPKTLITSDFAIRGSVTLALTASQMFDTYPTQGDGQGNATIDYEGGGRTVAMRSGFNDVRVVTFTNSAAQLDTLILGTDPNNTQAIFNNTSQAGPNTIRRLASVGFVNRLQGAASIFPAQGSRLIFYTKQLAQWYDIELIALDARAASIITGADLSLTMSEDGYFYVKRDVNATAGNDILASPAPEPQVLPLIVPSSRLPAYGHYDTPYGART